jgi:hypothetical protein
MKKVIEIISKVPDDLFIAALDEVLKIDWDNLPMPDRRAEHGHFKTSITNHIRVHKVTKDTPHTIEVLSAIVDCMDMPARKLYPNVDKLVEWIYNSVEGTKLGRIMLVKLMPGGTIGAHIDPGQYFLEHYRFHVPFITAPEVLFYGEEKEIGFHMPEGHLSQLANRRLHSAKNLSNIERIHLIVDIDSDNPTYNI